MKTVSYTMDTLPPLTEEGKRRLAALEDLPDGSVDDPDNPVFTSERWAKRVPSSYCRTKKEVSVS
jgi:hypothetical protein